VARFNSELVGVGVMIGCVERRGERLGLVVGHRQARDSDRIWSEMVRKGFPLQYHCVIDG